MSKISTLYKEQQIKLIKEELKEAKKELKANHGTNKQIEKLLEEVDDDQGFYNLGFDYGFMRGLEVALSYLKTIKTK